MGDGVMASRPATQGDSVLIRVLRHVRDLFSRRREPYHPSGELFLELDLRDVRAALRHRERARENGERNLPSSDTAVLDHAERDIVAFIGGEQRRTHEQCVQQLQVFNERIRSIQIAILHSNVSGKVQAACADLRALALRGRNELFDLQRRVTSLTKELEAFRARHLLDREAHIPESLLWYWAILVAMLVAETVLNGIMLSRGTPGGLLEGFTTAFALAALNLCIAGVIGRVAFSLLNHRRPSVKTIGTALAISGIFASIGFNLAVGHYRDALGGPAPENASREALARFLNDPFTLADVQSWTLCALGLLFAVVAAIDTYRMDDPYWGYGAITRRNEVARNDFIAERQDLIEAAAKERDDTLDQVHEVAEQIGRVGQNTTSLLRQQQVIIDKFVGYQDYLERTGALLLSEYRAENERVRTTPPPIHFREEWRLSRIVVAAPSNSPPELGQLSATLEKHRADIMAAFEAAITEIKSVQDLVDSGEVPTLYA